MVTSDGRPLKEKYIPKCNKKGYPVISVRMRKQGIDQKVLVHQVVAHQKFGDTMYTDGILCRHLDNDKGNFNSDNIVLGTSKDNWDDNTLETKEAIAKIAENAGKARRVLCEEDIQTAVHMRAKGSFYRQIATALDVSQSTIYYALSGKTYKEFHRELGERLKPEIC